MSAAHPAGDLRVVTFGVMNERYAIPVTQVREALKLQPVTPLPQAPGFIEGVVNVRGRVFAVTDLRNRLGHPPRVNGADARILVVRLPKSLVGLIVDEVDDVTKIPADAMQSAPSIAPETERFLSGIAKLGDHLVFVLDPQSVFSADEADALARARGQGTGAAAA